MNINEIKMNFRAHRYTKHVEDYYQSFMLKHAEKALTGSESSSIDLIACPQDN